jgi:hypothetical protein
VERGVFPRPEIEERLAKFVLVRLWINDPDPKARSKRWRALLESRFGTTAIPLYAALSKEDAELGRIAFPGGTLDAFAADLGAMLDAALAAVGR